MESNKDEAERCIEIAIAALRDSEPDKARRFLEKAQRLFPTDKARCACNVNTCIAEIVRGLLKGHRKTCNVSQ